TERHRRLLADAQLGDVRADAVLHALGDQLDVVELAEQIGRLGAEELHAEAVRAVRRLRGRLAVPARAVFPLREVMDHHQRLARDQAELAAHLALDMADEPATAAGRFRRRGRLGLRLRLGLAAANAIDELAAKAL